MSLHTRFIKSLFCVACVLGFSNAQAQSVYWREGFDNNAVPPCTIQSNSANVIVQGVGIGHFTSTAGTWYVAGAYRTTGTACATPAGNTASHIRFHNSINDANFPTSGIDTAYVVTPVVNFGIGELHLLRSRASRGMSFYITSDTSATTTNWTLVTSPAAFSGTVTCVDTTILINSSSAKRVKIVSKRGSTGSGLDNDIDSVWMTSTTPIPVELVAFKGAAKGSVNVLEWTTASERNNDAFIIERSFDSKTFERIASVKGHGTTQSIQNYSFTDNNPTVATRSLNNIAYYRLRQVDFDGQEDMSKIIAITREGNTKVGLSKIYPSVTSDVLTVDMESNGVTSLKVTDITGRTVLTKQLGNINGVVLEKLDVSNLASGLYIVTLQTNGNQLIEKFRKQ
ncbi:MAG: T9SS type A sorting domain-containing protein [Saprospiraceae bacterium]|nr:T9SS type A sorting domain-containing protein [Saprospiraceae bacterium]